MPLSAAPPPEVMQVQAGWFVGAYRFSQAPAEDAGPLYPSNLSFGYSEAPALTRGLAIDARAWLSPRFGVELSGRGAAYTEDFNGTGSVVVPPPEARTLEQATLGALARDALPLGQGTLCPEVQVGLWGGSIMVHGQAMGDDGAVEPEVRQAMMGGPYVGAGGTLTRGAWSLRADARLGATSNLTPAWVNSALDLQRGLTHGLFVALDLESSSRIAALGAPSGDTVGTVSDRLSGAALALGYAR